MTLKNATYMLDVRKMLQNPYAFPLGLLDSFETKSCDLNKVLMNLINTALFCNIYNNYFMETAAYHLGSLAPELVVNCN